MERLSLSSAVQTPLPPSSPAITSTKSPNGKRISSTGFDVPAKSPLHRATSSSSIGNGERDTTPTLHKRASIGSLRSNGGITPPRSPAARRTSSYFSSSSNTTMSARSSLPPPPEEPPRAPVTAASVAHDFFEKELEGHQNENGFTEQTRAIVILQDDCYGHRFSRPRTSRANLSTIVERPERIHASILGLAAAYVRLGGRHAEGPVAPHPARHESSLPPKPFKIQKTARRLPLRSPAASAIHGAQWMEELANMCNDAESKLALSGKELTRTSTPDQPTNSNKAEKAKLHEGDLYLCSGSLNALEGALGGVCEGVDAVFNGRGPKRAFVCIRPPGHHCSAEMPSGFCWLNNVHVGIGHAVLTHGLTHAAIIDFDLHHGDGSQSITWARNSRITSMPKNAPLSKKTAIGYYSLHDINSYPCEEGDDEKVRNASLCIENAHGQNIWNVHLQPWKTEAEFWRLYEDKYSVILTKAREFLRHHSEKLRHAPTHPKPKAAIFLSAGFDASEWESPGMQRHQVNVPTSFYARLTSDVVAMAEEEGLGVDGRVISVLEGGYSDRALMSGVLSHVSGLTVPTGSTANSLTQDGSEQMSRNLGALNSKTGDVHPTFAAGMRALPSAFEPDWWSLQRLEEVETLINPPVIAAPPKKQRNEVRPTYTSATQSFTAKIVTPPHGRRSFSGAGVNLPQLPTSRAPSPPPPAVDWATAAYELSKLLVPSDRETKSCRPEDLNAEASRARRNRYSSVGAPAPTEVPAQVTDPKRMQLRERRGKTPKYVSEDEEERPLSRANRRKTIADVSLLNEDNQAQVQEPNPVGAVMPTKHARRRSSIASSASSMNAEKGSDFSLGSVAEAQPKVEALIVKKARAAANSRMEGAKPKVVKKQPPVPSFSSTSSTAPLLENGQPPAATAKENASVPQNIKEKSKNHDLDELASGMRTMSIKLNVPPKEEYQARQDKAKTAARGRSTKPAPSKKTSPTKTKAKLVKDPSAAGPKPSEPLPIQQLPTPPMASVCPQESGTALRPASERPIGVVSSDAQVGATRTTPPPAQASAPPPTMPFDGSEAAMADNADKGESQTEALNTTPPAVVAPPEPMPVSAYPNTPSTVKRTKQELPIFTPKSQINFGNSNVNSSNTVLANNEVDQAMRDPISNTALPSLDGSKKIQGDPFGDAVFTENQPAHLPSQPKSSETDTSAQSSASIWDVPNTPKPRKV
ncbi:histone deacetylase [Lecanora helva]